MVLKVEEIEKSIESMNTKIKKADDLIIQLEKVSRSIEESKTQLNNANQKFEQLTITDTQIKNEMSQISEQLNTRIENSFNKNSIDMNAHFKLISIQIENLLSELHKEKDQVNSRFKKSLFFIMLLILLSIVNIIFAFIV